MKLSNKILSSLAAILMLSPTVWADTMTIPNSFTSGTPAVAADVNANFSAAKNAVDANDGLITANGARITAVESVSGDNTSRITALEYPSTDVVSSIRLTVGRPEGYTSGGATFHFLLSNKTGTDCDISTAVSADQWQIGPNTKGMSTLLFRMVHTLPGIIKSGFPFITTTYTIVDRAYTVDFSANDYAVVSLTRYEGDATDTCASTDVMVRGVIITYPGAVVGDMDFIAPAQLKIQ